MSLMTEKDWDIIRYFSIDENWGNPLKIEKDLMVKLEQLRMSSNKPIIIHCAYSTDGHSKESYHYKGMAVDLHITNMKLLDQFLWAERLRFTGIGVYPYWNNPGLHLDIRPGLNKRWYKTKLNAYENLTSIAFINNVTKEII